MSVALRRPEIGFRRQARMTTANRMGERPFVFLHVGPPATAAWPVPADARAAVPDDRILLARQRRMEQDLRSSEAPAVPIGMRPDRPGSEACALPACPDKGLSGDHLGPTRSVANGDPTDP